MAHNHRHGRVKISELPEVKNPSPTDVLVLNVNDSVTAALKYSDLVVAMRDKISPQSDYNQTDSRQLDYIKNKPNVYIKDVYIPSLTFLY